MRRLLFLLVVPALSVMAQTPLSAPSVVHGPAVTKALEASRDANLKIDKKGAVDAKQVDKVLLHLFDEYRSALSEWKIAQAQAEQGGSAPPATAGDEMFELQVRYHELFPNLTDEELFPITDIVLNDAPESTFVGLTVYRKNGSDFARVTDKVKRWQPDYTAGSGRFYPAHYDIRLVAIHGELLNDQGYMTYFRWADLKNKIAFDATTKKREEDHQLEVAALTRH